MDREHPASNWAPWPTRDRTAAIVVVLLGFAPLLLNCGGAPAVREPSSPTTGAPYDDTARMLFDDALAPAVLGVPAEQILDTRPGSRLFELVRAADRITAATIRTITEGSTREGEVVEIEVVSQDLAQSDPSTSTIQRFALSRMGGANALLGAGPERLIGARLLVFEKSFFSGSGQSVHFHGEVDSPTVRAAIAEVRDALSLELAPRLVVCPPDGSPCSESE